MSTLPTPDSSPRLTHFQISATVVAGFAIALSVVFVLGRIFPAILWAGVLAIALWPTYLRIRNWHQGPGWRRIGAPATFTLLIAVVIAAPIGFAVFEGIREVQSLMMSINDARLHGVLIPPSLGHFPWLGPRLSGWWQTHLSLPRDAQILFHDVGPSQLMGLTRNIGPELLHRGLLFFVTLATLFFLFRDGEILSRHLIRLGERAFGPRSTPIAHHLVDAVHATVDGLVLVGLVEGAVIGVGYIIAGLPHAVSFSIVTGILAAIPFGAPLTFCVAATVLIMTGKTWAAVSVLGFGFLVVFIADHFVRPIVIGGSARIPFLLVLIGILGGLSSLGLVGLFVGPALMAMLVAIWRDVAGSDSGGELA
jgi:predicted PurR-regulated permease PerM